jgi:HK97 family phage portal protein
MSLLDSLFNRFGYVKAADLSSAPEMLRASAVQSSYNDWLNFDVDPTRFARMYKYSSWLQGALVIVGDTSGGQAINIKQRKGKDTEDIENHPFETLLAQPNPMDSYQEFVAATAIFRQLMGSAYWWVNTPSPNAPPTEMWVLPSYNVEPIPDKRLYLAGYKYQDGGYETIIPVHEIVHFRRFNPSNMLMGLSAIQALAVSVEGDIAMQSWNTNFFAKNNAKPEGGLFFGNTPQDSDWDKLKSDLRKEHGGTTRNLLLMRGVPKEMVQYLQMGVSQKDMEFIAGRTFTKEEIYNAVAPGLASVLAVNATEANAVAGEATLTARAVWPLLTSIAAKITSALLPRYGQNLIAEFDDPRRQDKALELQTRQVQMKYMTVDELRAEDNIEPIGDERGKMLPVEIEKGGAVLDKPEPQPVPTQLQNFAGQKPDTQTAPPDNMPPNNSGNPPTPEEMMMGKAMTVAPDLRLWQKKALRLFATNGTGVCAFDSPVIPADVRNRVAYGLAKAQDTGAIRAVFKAEIETEERPYRDSEIQLATAIRRASAYLTTESA